MFNGSSFSNVYRNYASSKKPRAGFARALITLILAGSLLGVNLTMASASPGATPAASVPASSGNAQETASTAASPSRVTNYYLADRVIKNSDFAKLANWGINTAVVDFDVNGAASNWRAVFTSAQAAGINVVIWPSDWNDPRPNCGWEAPYPISADGDITKVKRLLDVASQYPNFIGIVNAHESFWTCTNMTFDEMAGLKTKLKAYALSRGRSIKVWNYIDNLYDTSMLPDKQIERIMDVAVTWQHCAGNVEGTCNTSSRSSALNMILSDRKRVEKSGAQVELVFIMQTFTTRGYTVKFTLNQLQDYSCQFLNTSALDGFGYYTWGAGWWSDLHAWPELQPAVAYIYNTCVHPSQAAPFISSIVRAGKNPTPSASVDFTVAFSEAVTGVDAADFSLSTGGDIIGAAVSGVTGSDSVYTVKVNVGAGSGLLRLDVPAGATITDLDGNSLTGLPFAAGQSYQVVEIAAFTSSASQDGLTLESKETSNVGGAFNSRAVTLRLGDDAARRQYRSILSFDTSSLPDKAVIAKVFLKVKQQSVTGGVDPVSLFGGFVAEIRKGTFGSFALEKSDFQAAADKALGPFSPSAVDDWYTLNLTGGKAYVNKISDLGGLTQIRLCFKLDDNNDALANYLSLYSGNAGAADRPQLIIEYYVP